MKKSIKPFIAGLSLVGLITLPAFAETSDNHQQIEKLEKEVSQLQSELHTLNAKVNRHNVRRKAAVKQANPVTYAKPLEEPIIGIQPVLPPTKYAAVINAPPYNLPQSGIRYLPVDLDTPGQSFVSTGPYLGVPLEYSGSNLIINNPQINEDVSLLKLRKNINMRLSELGFAHPEDHGHLLLSGLAEAQANYKYRGPNSGSSDIDVTSAKLDAYILGPSSWVSGLITFAYENDIGSTSGVITSMHRVSNSRVFIDKAFITLGDFTKSPVYGSVGQMYVPFGTYSTNLVTSPVTKTLARTKARALLAGYQGQGDNAPYASAYIFKGDSYPAGNARKINNGGINVGYRFKREGYHTDIGGGVIGNIADSIGMQRTENDAGANPLFGGFGSTVNSCGIAGSTSCGNESLVHRVPAYDIRGLFVLGEHWNLLGEYIWSATRFNPNDLSQNGRGAKPQAFNTELAYTFNICNKPTSLVGGYQLTKDALAIGLPAKRYSLVLNTSVWRDTLQSLEFRHDIDYSGNVVSTGSGVAGPTGTGQSDNVITLQFDLYF
jgi:hypothetical protein